MFEQVDKPKENKNRAVADSITQKKSNVKQGFEFVDNRPEIVLQRKPLNSGVLNVVGENHNTSDEFRTWESEYAREKTGGSYWQEDEFRINVPKRGGEAEETVSVFGDPKTLQMANIIQFNTKALSDIIKFLTRIKNVKATKFNLSLNRMLIFSSLELIKTHLPRLKAFGGLYKELRSGALDELAYRPDLKEICDFYINFGDEFYDVFVTGVDQWATNAAVLNEAEANAVELNHVVTTGVVFIPNGSALLIKMFEKEEVSELDHDQRKNSVILARSKEMHHAGTTGKASKGVWKIGNQHVADIKEKILKGAQPKYELMTEDEFFADFNKWSDQKRDHQNKKDRDCDGTAKSSDRLFLICSLQ